MIKYVKRQSVIVICLLLIFMITLKDLEVFNRIYVIGDEFGYWANASWAYGLDWSSVASVNPYYSFGYSLWLIPFFLIKDSVLMYKVAIVLNTLFMCITFALVYDIAKMFMKKFSKNVLAIKSLSIVLYSNNVFSAGTTQCESLLMLMYTLIFWLFCKYAQRSKKIFLLLATFASCYMFYVHMRSLGILMAACMCSIIFLAIEKDWKKVLLLCSGVLIAFASYNLLKDVIIANVYSNNEFVKVNDYSEQINKVNAILSVEGVIKFVKSLLGKIFYLGTSTFFLFYWCVFYLIKKAYQFLIIARKREGITNDYAVWLFAILSIGSTVCITVISVLDPYRVDAVFYGRYNEMLIVPILILGIMGIVECKYRWQTLLGISAVQFILAVFTYGVVQNSGVTKAYGNNMSVLSSMAWNQNGSYTYEYFTVVATIKAFLIILVFIILLEFSNRKKVFLYIAFIELSLAWGYYGIQWTDNMIVEFQQNVSNNELVHLIKEKCDERGTKEVFGYVYNEEDTLVGLRFDFIQYLLPDYIVRLVEIESLNDIEEDSYFVVDKASNINDLLRKKCQILYESQNFYLMYRAIQESDKG